MSSGHFLVHSLEQIDLHSFNKTAMPSTKVLRSAKKYKLCQWQLWTWDQIHLISERTLIQFSFANIRKMARLKANIDQNSFYFQKITPWWRISFQNILFRRWLIWQNCLRLSVDGIRHHVITLHKYTYGKNTFKHSYRLKYYITMKPTPDFLPLTNGPLL